MQYFNLGGGNSIRLATGTAAPTVDPDAQAFITAAAITNPTQQSAVNQLVVDLKGYGVWTKMKALYPFVGGTASQHKFNLKDSRDLDAAFRLVFNGGVTHTSTGITFNGTNGYADTKLNENSVCTVNNTHISIYSRTNNDGLHCDIGVSDASIIETNIFAKYLNNFYPRVNATNNGIANSISSLGLFISNRISSNEVRARQNSALKLISNNSIQKVNRNFYIGAMSNSNTNASNYSNRNYSFASIGDGLTDTEAANFYTAVQNFQVALSRNV